jgi:PAS domain S-box-containing protein
MTKSNARNRVWRGSFCVVLAYAFFAGLWILLSDRAMGLLFSDPQALVQASMAKGWFFVAVTSLLLYVLVSRLVNRLDVAHQRDLEYQRAQKQAPPMLVAIADASDDAIFAKDEEGRYLLFNNAAARFVGKPAEAVLGKDDRALFPPGQADPIMAVDRRVRESGQTETLEELLQTAAGERYFLAIKGPLRGADCQIFGTYGISRDITERKIAEENIKRRNAELEHFNRVAIDRELRMIALKREVNDMARAAGRPAPYDTSFADTP